MRLWGSPIAKFYVSKTRGGFNMASGFSLLSTVTFGGHLSHPDCHHAKHNHCANFRACYVIARPGELNFLFMLHREPFNFSLQHSGFLNQSRLSRSEWANTRATARRTTSLFTKTKQKQQQKTVSLMLVMKFCNTGHTPSSTFKKLTVSLTDITFTLETISENEVDFGSPRRRLCFRLGCLCRSLRVSCVNI